MSSDAFNGFKARVQSDAGLQQELRDRGSDTGMSVDALVAFAATKGYAFKVEDVSGELSEHDLSAVAGGTVPPEPVLSAFTVKLTNLSNLGSLSVRL